MSLPTSTDLVTLDFSYLGSPFCETAATSSIDLLTMDVSYLGQPFVRNANGGAAPPVVLGGAKGHALSAIGPFPHADLLAPWNQKKPAKKAQANPALAADLDDTELVILLGLL